jgi:hypothetical protein
MKLAITTTCVADGGVVLERGNLYTTKSLDTETDKEAFTLISAGRALQVETPEGKAFLDQIASETAAKVAAAAKK